MLNCISFTNLEVLFPFLCHEKLNDALVLSIIIYLSFTSSFQSLWLISLSSQHFKAHLFQFISVSSSLFPFDYSKFYLFFFYTLHLCFCLTCGVVSFIFVYIWIWPDDSLQLIEKNVSWMPCIYPSSQFWSTSLALSTQKFTMQWYNICLGIE